MTIKEDTARELLAARGKLCSQELFQVPDGWGALADTTGGRKLLAAVLPGSVFTKAGQGGTAEDKNGIQLLELPLNANNAALVRRYVKGAGPTACGSEGISIGFCDWLGVPAVVLPKLFQGRHLKPVLVDLSPEDCTAAGKNLLDPISMVTWQVLASGFKQGYGACASQLKDEQDFLKVLLYMYSSLGFDAGHLAKTEILGLSAEQIHKKYLELPEQFRKDLEASYLNAEFQVGQDKLHFTQEQLEQVVLTYGEAIMHIQTVYNTYFQDTPWPLDLELDLSRAGIKISPQAHYLIANELKRNGMHPSAVCLDAELDLEAVTGDLQLQGEIAAAFGSKLSINNADLRFEDLGAVAKKVGGRIHFKLNHVLWLAALQTLAETVPELLGQVAARAKLPVPKTEELQFSAPLGQQYAREVRRILKAANAQPALPLAAAVEKAEAVYNDKVKAAAEKLLQTL